MGFIMKNSDPSFKASRSPLKIVQSVVFALFMREMQTRFGARRLGLVWVVMEPLGILTIILSFYSFFRASPVQGIDFVMYMVSGIVPFHMMRNIAWRIIDAIPANAGLFAYRQVTPFDTFLVRLIVEVCVYCCAYLIICGFLGFWFDHDVLIADPLAWIFSFGVGIVLSFSIGVLFAIISHAAPSTSRILKLSYIPIYITSGVFYPLWRMPKEKMEIMSWNPYVEVINSMRAATFENYPETYGLHSGYPIFFALVSLLLSLGVYRLRRQDLRVIKP